MALTTDADPVIGSADSDTITAASGTLNSTDLISDAFSGDNDTLNAVYKAADMAATPTIAGVENINISIDAFDGTAATFNATNVKGATITLTSSKLGFNGEAGVVAAGANNVTAGAGVTEALTVTGLTTGVVNAGSAKVVDVTTDDADDVANVVVNGNVDLTIQDAEEAKITATADAKVDLAAVAVTKLTVAGTGNTTIIADELAGDEIVNTKTAGTLTASVSGNADVEDWDVDTIAVTNAAALTNVGLAGISITEKELAVSAAGADAAKSNVVVSTALSQTSVTVTAAKTATVNLTAAVTVGTLALNDIATTINVAGDTVINTLSGAESVTVAGSGNVEVGTLGGAATEVLLNAAALTGALEVTTAATTGTAAINGGSGNDVIDATSVTVGTIAFEGGAGDDKLIVDGNGAATIVFAGGAGNDTLVLEDGTDLTAAKVSLSGVETLDVDGATAEVSSSLVSGKFFTITGDGFSNSTLTVTGVDKAGAEADTIDLSGLTASSSVGVGGVSIVVDGGAGIDQITLGNAVETVVLGAVDAGLTNLDVITGFSSSDRFDFGAVAAVKNLVSGTDAVAFAKGTATGQFASLADVLATFVATTGANALAQNGAVFFSYDSKTYALIDGGTAGYAEAEDALIQLVGTDVTTLGLGNFI